MFWPIVLPFQITACLMAGVIVCVTLAAPLARLRRGPTLLVASLVGVVAFVPSCTGVMSILDARRFGVFTYDAYADVDDFRVERYLPPAARNITLDKYAQGFRARYAISEGELTSYLDELWASCGERSCAERGELAAMDVVDRESHQRIYGDLGWPYLSNAREFFGPIADNGAGFSVWFSASEQMAYERAGYW